MLEVKNLNIIIENNYIIKDLSFNLNSNDKLAIIGEEGNGKSTILKSLINKCDYAEMSGIINTNHNRIGYLPQYIEKSKLKYKVYDFLFKDEEDYYNKINDLYKNLNKINLEDKILNQTINTLSGGEKVKINILKLLLEDYDILFLDEPTNDLDIDTLNFLESFIKTTTKPIIYVSHDETLLQNTANRILHIERIKHKKECRHTLENIGFKEYVDNRERKIEKQNQVASKEKRDYKKQEEKLKQIMQKVEYRQKTITRKDPYGAALLKKKMRNLKSQEKRLEKKVTTEKVEVEENINFSFENTSIPKNKIIINLNLDELKVKDKVLSKNIKLDIIGNTKICIIGKNGCGKSTLIKIIYEKLKPREDIKVGYMPQNYDDVFNDYENVLDFIAPSKKLDDITKARTYLSSMNFTKDETEGKVKDLSNGTKAKLFLIKLVLDKCNVLILDEPTRNLSPLSNPVLRKVLKEFKGTIISISHDRLYINEVIDKVYLLTETSLYVEDNFNK